MSKILFIRNAEPVRNGNDFHSPLSERGVRDAKKFRKENLSGLYGYEVIAFSNMKRSIETAILIFKDPDRKFDYEYQDYCLNEWDKGSESKEVFIKRVTKALDKMRSFEKRIICVSHARFMTAAYQLLKPNEIVLGFDFLDSFEAEL